MALNITAWEATPGVFIIKPKGELVINNHEFFERKVKELLNLEPTAMIFDLEDVDYISSMGLRTLLVAHKNMMKLQGHLFLINLQPQVKKILDIVNAFPSEQIFSSSDELMHFLEARKNREDRGVRE